MADQYWGVYRVFKNGKTRYVRRSATSNEKLAREIAADFTEGRVVRPDGSLASVRAWPHEARPIDQSLWRNHNRESICLCEGCLAEARKAKEGE